jgi:hypothetical protein
MGELTGGFLEGCNDRIRWSIESGEFLEACMDKANGSQ